MAQGTWCGGPRVSTGCRIGWNIAHGTRVAGGAHLRRLQALQEGPHARLLRALAAALRVAARQAASGATGAPSATVPHAGEAGRNRHHGDAPWPSPAARPCARRACAPPWARAPSKTPQTQPGLIRARARLSTAPRYQQARARERGAAARVRVAACRGVAARGRRARGARAGHCEVVVSLRACALFMPTAFLSMKAGGGGLPSSSASVSHACGVQRVRRAEARRPTALDTRGLARASLCSSVASSTMTPSHSKMAPIHPVPSRSSRSCDARRRLSATPGLGCQRGAGCAPKRRRLKRARGAPAGCARPGRRPRRRAAAAAA